LNPRWFFQAIFTAKLPTSFGKRTGLQIQSKVVSQILRFTFDLGLLILIFSGPEYLNQVAWLALANRILAHALSFSAFPLNQIQEPLFAHLFTRKNDHALIQNNYNLLTKYYTVFTMPFLTILIGFGHLLIPFIYGQSFSPSSPSLIILSVTMMFCTYWSLAPKMLIAFEQHKFYDITSLLFTLLLGGIFFLAGTHHKFQLAFLSLCVLRVLFHGALSFYVIHKYHIQREWDWLGKTLVCNLLWLPPLFIKKVHPLGMGITLLSLSLLFLWVHKKMGVLTNQDKANFARLSLPFKDKILACL
jgi:O-antigen/teichoic acid export membrane protein